MKEENKREWFLVRVESFAEKENSANVVMHKKDLLTRDEVREILDSHWGQ